MSLTLHKVGVFQDDNDKHVFTFILDNVAKFTTSSNDVVRGIESSDINYGGHSWSIVCARKEDQFVGIFLKWRCTDGPSLSAMAVKVNFSLSLIHRYDYTGSKQFSTTQKFCSGQTLYGKSRLIGFSDLIDVNSGYLDSTGRNVVIEVSFTSCTTRYDQTIDISPPCRTRKNASGIYFDTSTFVLASHRWYLRFYLKKLNSNGLPAVYLYLASKSKGVSMELEFILYLLKDFTEILNYAFGDDAKFEGFGKTLPEPLVSIDKLSQVTVSVEIHSLAIYKLTTVRLSQQSQQSSLFSSVGSRAPQFSTHGLIATTQNGLSNNGVDTFQDQDGNMWRVEVKRPAQWLTVNFDKAVHHYANNRTRIICWSAVLLSRDIQKANHVATTGLVVTGYYSNFIDEKGFLVSFPVKMTDLEDRSNSYIDESGCVLLRINLLSVQSTPVTMRSVPHFDYQLQHLLKARQELRATNNLLESRDMSASRGSLSNLAMIDDINDLGGRYKSSESIDAISSNDSAAQQLSSNSLIDCAHLFMRQLLRELAERQNKRSQSDVGDSIRMGSNAAPSAIPTHCSSAISESSSTESTTDVDCWQSLINESRCNVIDEQQYHDVVATLINYFKRRIPFRIAAIVELGSLGTGTVARSRVDVDLVIISPDLPRECHEAWLPAVLESLKSILQPFTTTEIQHLPGRCTDWRVTPYSVQFACAGVDVDITLTSDWSEFDQSGYDALYDVTCKQVTAASRKWYSHGTALLRKKFLVEQPNEVKGLIKFVKHWRNGVSWRKAEYRPNSYLLSLLVIKAVEEIKQVDVRLVVQRLGIYILSSELRLSWSLFYKAGSYQVEFDPPTPLVRDPTNPGINVAETVTYWGQLRTEYSQWLRSLNITLR